MKQFITTTVLFLIFTFQLVAQNVQLPPTLDSDPVDANEVVGVMLEANKQEREMYELRVWMKEYIINYIDGEWMDVPEEMALREAWKRHEFYFFENRARNLLVCNFAIYNGWESTHTVRGKMWVRTAWSDDGRELKKESFNIVRVELMEWKSKVKKRK